MRSAPPNPYRVAGFSLVEVTLSIGIFSLSILSLIGMLPSGLGTLRNSMDQTVHAQIVQRIAADLALAESSNITQTKYFFDEEGQFLTKSSEAPARASYAVELAIDLPSLPGLNDPAQITSFQDHLKRVRIGVARVNATDSSPFWYALQISSH